MCAGNTRCVPKITGSRRRFRKEYVMSITYTSTRDHAVNVTASQAILQGLSRDGGLFVPTAVPKLDIALEELSALTYQETAYRVMRLFFEDFTEEELRYCINSAYDSKFDTQEIAPLHKTGDAWYLELFHGKTIAFKDMALSILPYLMTTSARKNHIDNDIVILTATSGDTGKAALAGFADVPGTKIIVFYPKHGVSVIQERQMVTQKGDNAWVVGIEGNFDEAQSGVKAIFSDELMREQLLNAGYQFSSANSINIGRLVPQIVYYVYAYGRLVKEGALACGEEMNVTVPTGNFGNILAAHYAKQMGLPIHRLICASNENRVLTDFFETGVYDRNRAFMLTNSPSMDILISSNLERLIYEITGRDAEKNADFMAALAADGRYALSDQMKEKLDEFAAGSADEKETGQEIHRVFETFGYVLDTHTAVASKVYSEYVKNSKDHTPSVIASTASPYKFTRSVMEAIGSVNDGEDDFALAESLSGISGVAVPEAVTSIKDAPVLHDLVIPTAAMADTVKNILNIGK